MLEPAARSSLPFLTWSAGQREFIPLLLGLYRLMPAGGVGRRGALAWAIIEEPEMGLHPRAIAATMAFVVELLRRQYRVVLSTHFTQVLDVVWGLRTLSELDGTTADVAELLDLHETKPTKAAAQSALVAKHRTYYFDRGEAVRDISDLDPMSDDPTTAGWGGLTAFSERVANVVARAVARSDRTEAERRCAVWVEVHPANPGAVDAMLRKAAWLRAWLEGHPTIDALTRNGIAATSSSAMFWVPSGRDTVAKGSTSFRKLATSGIVKVRRVELP